MVRTFIAVEIPPDLRASMAALARGLEGLPGPAGAGGFSTQSKGLPVKRV